MVQGQAGNRPRQVELGVVQRDRVQIRAGLDKGQTVFCRRAQEPPAARSEADADRRVVALAVITGNILGEAFASLSRRRLQAALSSFGIATGIAAVVLLVSIVSGIHRYALEQIGAVGGNVIQVTAQQQRSTRDPQGFPLTLRVEDMDAVLAAVDHFDLGMAENSTFGIVRTPRRASQGVQVRGITDRGFEHAQPPGRARPNVPRARVRAGARVAVLGAALAADLFVQESPVGQTIFIGDWPFQVVGVLEWVGDPVAMDAAGPDGSLFIPFRACAAAFRGNEQAQMRPPAVDVASMPRRRRSPRRAPRSSRWRKRRGETSGEYQVMNTIERVRELTLVLTGLKIAVGLVGSIGLFVGAVGVANVLLVSVRERRAEIGVRRAVGATARGDLRGVPHRGDRDDALGRHGRHRRGLGADEGRAPLFPGARRRPAAHLAGHRR